MENENRLIYVTALKDRIRQEPTDGMYTEEILEAIDEVPTADAAPVVHGKWIDKTVWNGCFGHIRTQCSVCGTVFEGKPGSRGDGKGGKFCEECGAKMDLKEGDHGK